MAVSSLMSYSLHIDKQQVVSGWITSTHFMHIVYRFCFLLLILKHILPSQTTNFGGELLNHIGTTRCGEQH